MTEQEIASTILKYFVGNWGKVLSSFGALIAGTSTLTWFIFHTIHKKEIAVLQQRVGAHDDNFKQFSQIMEQRLALAESITAQLKEKLTRESKVVETVEEPKFSREVLFQRGISSKKGIPMFKRESSPGVNRMATSKEDPPMVKGVDSGVREEGNDTLLRTEDFLERVASLNSELNALKQML